MRRFEYPDGRELCIPKDWLDQSGILDFIVVTESYKSPPHKIVEIIPICQIAPPDMSGRLHLRQNGLDRDRMIDVLRGIAAGEAIEPIQVVEGPRGNFQKKTEGWRAPILCIYCCWLRSYPDRKGLGALK